MLKTITQKIQPILISTEKSNHSLKNRLIKGAAGSFGLKIAGTGLAFVMSIIFARFLGTVGLGTYSYATTWANLLSIPATLGLDQLMVREIAIYRAKSRWDLISGLLRWSNLVVLASSITLTLVAIAVIWEMKGESNTSIVIAVALAMVTVPIISLRKLKLGTMQGLHRIVLGQMPDGLFAPIIVISLTSIVYSVFPKNFNVFWVLAIKIVAITITFFIGASWLLRSLPPEVMQVKPQYERKQWLIAALPFMFLGTTHLINSRIDIIMLGGIKGVETVGIYTIIVAITKLTIFINQAANNVLGPTIASLYSEGQLKQLERLIHKSVLSVFLLSLIIGITMMGVGKYLLLIFGSDFISGRTAMNILIVGQIFNAFTGPVGLVLTMTGHQNYTATSLGLTAVLNIILNALMIPKWGINGAAIATTTSLIVINIINVIFMQRTLNISLYSLRQKKT
ncbi:flippase [Pleurocapsa sp. PCC 7319]|uniref:flippase n=1 Tax=Pleurocapsa sp. PCC 7319 TaxID=118161 RepID=UPI000346806B|nr:flippase [Pleurocapsa sp. PCC 7319]